MKIKLTPSRIGKLRPKSSEFTVWDVVTPHFGVKVAPTGSMRFIHLAPLEGKLKKRTIGDAKEMPLDVARAIACEINFGEERRPNPCPLLSEWVDTWWPQAKTRLKPGTQRNYRNCLKRHLLPTFGEMRLDAIDKNTVLPWFERISRRTPGGANHTLSMLSAILNNAKMGGIIPTNPVRRIRRNPTRKMTRFLSGGERGRLLAAIDALPPCNRKQGMIIKMLLSTGCRLNEIMSLKWEEVGDGVLNLASSKTGARKVWLGPEAVAVLEEARSMRDALVDSKYVFPSFVYPDRCFVDIDGIWRKLRVEAGIPDVRLHDLRHSFASEAVRQGIALPVVSKLLGHSNIKMTMRYAHASNAECEEAAERIAKRITDLLGGNE